MRRWIIVFVIPLAFLLTVCISERGVTGGDDREGPAGVEKGEGEGNEKGGLALPWKPKVIADTIEDLSDPEWEVRGRAIRKVVEAGRWIVPFLLVALKNPEPLNRQEAAYCLGRIGDSVAVPTLVEVLMDDPPYDVIVYTVEAVGWIGDPSAAEAVKPFLKYSLEREEYGRQIGPVELKVIDSREATVRHAGAEALARLGDSSGIPLIIRGLTGNGWIRRDASVRLRRLTGCKVDFGFHLDMKDTEKKKARDAWLAWWEENKGTFKPAPGYPRDALDVYMPRGKKK